MADPTPDPPEGRHKAAEWMRARADRLNKEFRDWYLSDKDQAYVCVDARMLLDAADAYEKGEQP